jgi:alpha-galactosidase
VYSLDNPYLHFSLDPNTGHWSLRPQHSETPCLESVRPGFKYRLPSQPKLLPKIWEGDLFDIEISQPESCPSPHGPLNLLRLTCREASPALAALTLEFALPEDSPFLLWRLIARNDSDQPLTLQALDLALVGARFKPIFWQAKDPPSSGELRLHPSPGRLAFFSNGYQSWSFAGALQADQRQPASRLRRFSDAKNTNLMTPMVKWNGHFTSDMFGVLGDRDHNIGLVAGFLSQREQFGIVEVVLDTATPSLRLTAQCDDITFASGETRATDWAYLQFIALDDFDPLAEYAEAVARENGARVPLHTPVGWCSWYHYFDKVAEKDITANLVALAQERERLPLDFVQLDDGFQAQVGDWFETNRKFPNGLAWLAQQIRARRHTPGLWLAPFVVRSDAKLMRQHPDWFLRTSSGRLVSAGLNWFRWCYGLDPTHPGVREHTHKLISTAVNEWGFPYLKLDFLYAAALPAQRYDPALTRAQAMRLALKDIREAAGPETFLLGCGCPLGSAVGLVDGMRISTDAAPNWKPELFTPALSQFLHNEMDFPSIRSAIRNTINRAPLHRRWWVNDPDCLLVRDHDTRLNEAEVRSLATVIALSGGMFLVSDNMTRLKAERQRYIAPLLPVLNVSARAADWMSTSMPEILTLPLTGAGALGNWWIVGLFNWNDYYHDCLFDWQTVLKLDPTAEYFVSDFWEQRYWKLKGSDPLFFQTVPPHGANLVAVRPVTVEPMLVASTFHFSQGREFSTWDVGAHELRFTIDLNRVADGKLVVALPGMPHTATVENEPLSVRDLGDGVYSLEFTVRHMARVALEW